MTEAVFKAATEDVAAVADDISTDIKDADTVVTDASTAAGDVVKGDVPDAVTEGETAVKDTDTLIREIHAQVMSLRDLVVKAEPVLAKITEEINTKGLTGVLASVLPALLSGKL